MLFMDNKDSIFCIVPPIVSDDHNHRPAEHIPDRHFSEE